MRYGRWYRRVWPYHMSLKLLNSFSRCSWKVFNAPNYHYFAQILSIPIDCKYFSLFLRFCKLH
jgi:hypothetical protein